MPNNPLAPENIFAIKRHNYCIIKWDPVVYDTSATQTITVAAYEVYRSSMTNGLDYTVIATLTSTVTTTEIASIYTDISIQSDEVYFYKVRCLGEASSTLTVTIGDMSSEVSAIYFGDLLSVSMEAPQFAAARYDQSYWDQFTYN